MYLFSGKSTEIQKKKKDKLFFIKNTKKIKIAEAGNSSMGQGHK